MESLALKYRPQRFTDLVGQRAAQLILKQMVVTGRIPHALLFSGCRGTGKTTTARILAAALNCAAADAPCGTCRSCVATFDGSSMDVIEIDAASNGLVEDIRELRQHVLCRGGDGRHRVIILDEAHSMSGPAFNALLKTLEEPPPNTVFVLLTTEHAKIPDTVASRCMPFDFRRLSIADIMSRLAHVAQAEGLTVEEPLLRIIAEQADGAMRDALMRLEQVAAVHMSTAEQYLRLIGHHDPAPAILSAVANGDLLDAIGQAEVALTRIADPAEIVSALISALRDALVLHLGGEVAQSGVALEARQNLALALSQEKIFAAMRIFWQLGRPGHGKDARQALDLSITMLAELFGTYRTPNSKPEPKRISLAEMMERQ